MEKRENNKTFENFRDFIEGAEINQYGDATQRYQIGKNPEELPFHMERRPEIGHESKDSILFQLEQMQVIIDAGISKYHNLERSNDIKKSEYVKNELKKAYRHLKTAYLRIMDA